jgi:hypothetical protein
MQIEELIDFSTNIDNEETNPAIFMEICDKIK